MDDLKQRRLPRHVDGRIKVGNLPIKKFIIFLPIALLVAIFTFMNFTPITMMIGTFIIFSLYMLFSELNHMETGFDLLISMIKYKFDGDLYWERSCLNESAHKRCIRNKIER